MKTLLLGSVLLASAFGQGSAAVEGTTPDGLTAGDWGGIRAAWEAGRYAAFDAAEGYQARNPGQRWRTTFDGRGFTTLPDAGGWSWGLELVSLGFAGGGQRVTRPERVTAAGGRVAYEWSEALEEWFVNDKRGLEHGYTLRRRPARDDAAAPGPLLFVLGVRGSLRPEVLADGRGARFLSGAGAVVLTYTGLSVVDADGEELPARFERAGEHLRLAVEERGARYPLTIDPIAQQAYLKASNTETHDDLGRSVAISGDTVVVGAPFEYSNATGVNGDQSNNSLVAAGAAYVFVRSGTSWSQQAYLKASNTDAFDEFGWSVGVSGDTIVVGAWGEASNATGVDGNQSDNSAPVAGAAYVFARTGTTWSQQAYLKASNTEADDRFGWAVAVSGDTVVVGADFEDSSATGVNGNQADNGANRSGAAYVFTRSGTTWSQQAYLKASNTDNNDGFGFYVAASVDTVLVGAHMEDSNATGVGGNQSDDSAKEAGAAYVFARSGATWTQQAYLKASNTDPDDRFGGAVAVSGDTAVIGAPFEDSNAAGVNGDQSDNSTSRAGAAYVFTRSGTTWSQQAYLKASNPDPDDRFGGSTAVSGDAAVVSAGGEDSSSTGLNGDQGDNSASDAGAAYAFLRAGATWSQQAYLKASNTDAGDQFGYDVAVSGDSVLVGARKEASSATGVNGNQADNSTPGAGAGYVYTLCLNHQPAQEAARLGTPPNPSAFLPGVTRGPIVGAVWDPVVDHTSFAPAAVADFVGVDLVGALNVPTSLGTLLINLPPGSQVFVAAAGTPFAIPIPNVCSLVGVSAWSQAGSLSPGTGLALANALDLVLGTY